ncbi:restriction endonuclease subunit S [Streptomyces decoyicus]
MVSGGTPSMPTRLLNTVVASVSSGKTTRRDIDGRYPLYGSTGRIGRTNQVEFTGPSILVARVGANAGSVYRVDGYYGVTDNTLVIRPKTDQSVDFLFEVLRYSNLNQMVYGSGQPLVTGTMLKSLQIPDLSPASQRQIAIALKEANDLISAIERLIAKKQAIKQGAIQQLLTGRTRLQGFGGVWEYRRVAEMGEVLAGKALNVSGAGILRPYLRTKNVLDGRIDLEDVLWMPMTDAEFERFRIERGDVLLNEGQSLELVGRCSMYYGEFDAPCAMQNQLLRFRAFPGASPEFAAHLFRHCQRAGVFAATATKTTSVAHLGSSRLSNLRLLWPADRLEQAAIAEVLCGMDTEISACEVRLAKTRALKQGMMQELLTGRTRLTVKEGAA